MQEAARALAVLLPAVDAAPVDDDRRPGDAARDLQVAGERPALERDLDDLQRRVEVRRRLAEHAQRLPVGVELVRRARHRIARDHAVAERQHVGLGELLVAGALLGERVRLGLVVEADPAPRLAPCIGVEAVERRQHLLGVVAANALERIDAAGAAHHLRLDLVERAHSAPVCAPACGAAASNAAIAPATNAAIFMASSLPRWDVGRKDAHFRGRRQGRGKDMVSCALSVPRRCAEWNLIPLLGSRRSAGARSRVRVRCDIGSNQREVFMDKKLVGAIGAIAGLATLDTAAQATPAAAPAQPQGAKSFAELLDPIPNAVAALRAADAAARAAREQGVQDPAGEVQVAGYRHHSSPLPLPSPSPPQSPPSGRHRGAGRAHRRRARASPPSPPQQLLPGILRLRSAQRAAKGGSSRRKPGRPLRPSAVPPSRFASRGST